jgi:hypothetical protein
MTSSDFNTPPWILDLVRQLSPNGIGLDPCSNEHSMVNATTTYTIKDNGLALSWRGYGLVFVNPPHSTSPHNIEPWMEKARVEFLDQRPSRYDRKSDHLVMLIPAKPDTAWFHDVATKFAVRCFLRGRPRYWLNGAVTPGPGKFASMVTYHGPSAGRFISIFADHGWLA